MQALAHEPAAMRAVPPSLRETEDIPEKLDTLTRLLVYQKAQRVWRHALSPGASNMLFYLVDNTVGWGRDFLRASVDQLVNGTERGNWTLPPCGYSRRKVFQHLKELETAGAINITRRPNRASRYIVNLDWEPDVTLPTPKRKSSDRKGTPTGDREGTHKKDKTTKREDHFRAPRKSREVVKDDRSAEEKVEAIRKETTAKRSQSTDVGDVWSRAWAEGFPGETAPRLTRKDRGILRGFLQRVPDGLAVIEWSVANWTAINARQFQWASNPPSRPAAAWLMRFAEQYTSDFREIDQREAAWRMSPEARDYREAIAAGKTHEEALVEAGRRKALTDERSGLAKQAARIQRDKEALRLEREHLDRVARNTINDKLRNTKNEQAPPKINHGDNPFENDPDHKFVANWGKWEEDE